MTVKALYDVVHETFQRVSDEEAGKREAAAQQFNEVWHSGDADAADDIVSDDITIVS